MPTPDPARFRAAMAMLPTGVTIVSAAGPERPAGATANAVCSLSIEPMLMLACLDRGSRTLLAVQAVNHFCISVLHHGQESIARAFATKAPVAEKWDGVAWSERDGIPAFMGEREPLDDPSTTHGICPRHLTLMLGTLPSGSFPGVELLVIVRASDRALFEHLLWATSGVPDIRAIIERRRGERRRRIEGSVSERRERERRLRLGHVSAMGYTMVRLRRSSGQSSASPPGS